jgi:outer membrane protein OmpA-like peptidoglycan-associated protein
MRKNMKSLFLAAAAGFALCSCSAKLSQEELEEKRRAELELQSVQDMVANRTIPPVEFEFDSARLLESSYEVIDRVAEILKRHPSLKLIIEGHTDFIGSDEYNVTLSLRRASSVKQRLAEQGVFPDFVKVFGYGKSRPVMNGTSDQSRALNRRVEFIITTRHWESVF